MSDEERPADVAEAETESNRRHGIEYLLVDAGGRHAAVPLADVLRIEQLPLSRIEYVGYRPVLNFEGQLLPVEDSGGVLAAAESDPAAQEVPERQITVVVCRQGDRHIGIAVSHVLDVASGGDLFEAGVSQRTEGVTLLKDRVTGVVDLGSVPALPTGDQEPSEWNQLVETRS
jgi:two-component system chemotaxis sensor kinase CheA